MSEHPNATLVRRINDAMSRGDAAAVEGMLADDVVWHEIGRAEPIRGKAALRERMRGPGVDYEIAIQTHDVVANDEHAIALVEATATRQGRTFTYRTAEIFHVRAGQIAERWPFSDDTAGIAAFFA